MATKQKPDKIKRPNHKKRAIDALRSGSVSTWYAFTQLGNTRFAATIHQLKADGYVIDSEDEWSKNKFNEDVKYKRYTLISEPK